MRNQHHLAKSSKSQVWEIPLGQQRGSPNTYGQWGPSQVQKLAGVSAQSTAEERWFLGTQNTIFAGYESRVNFCWFHLNSSYISQGSKGFYRTLLDEFWGKNPQFCGHPSDFGYLLGSQLEWQFQGRPSVLTQRSDRGWFQQQNGDFTNRKGDFKQQK